MKNNKPGFFTKSLLLLLLLMNGWRPCTMSDGSKGWEKHISARIKRKGHLKYAITHLIGD